MPGGRAADPSPHGPHHRARVLRSALQPEHGGPHLGPGQRHAEPGRSPAPVPRPAPVSCAAARSALPPRAAPHGARAVFHRRLHRARRARLSPRPDGGLPDRDGPGPRSPICPTTSPRSGRTDFPSMRSGPPASSSPRRSICCCTTRSTPAPSTPGTSAGATARCTMRSPSPAWWVPGTWWRSTTIPGGTTTRSRQLSMPRWLM